MNCHHLAFFNMSRPCTRLQCLLLVLLPWTVDTALAAPNPIFPSTSRRRSEAAVREETARRIAEAEARGELEKNRLARETAATSSENLEAKARAALLAAAVPSEAEQRRQKEAATRLDAILENVSPEARERLDAPIPVATVVEDEDDLPAPPVILAQNGANVAIATPPPASTPSAGAPKPQPLKPTPLENPAIKASKTVITCTGSTFFDANKSIGIFTENVRVYHPQFYLECDEMEVFMKKNEAGADKPKPESPAEGSQPPPSDGKDSDKDEEEGSIDKIIARGALVLIEKFTENGQDIQVGKCKHLTYDGATGTVTLRNWPQVQRGAHLQIAEDPSTIMTISPKGEFKSSNGRTRTEILQGDAAKPKTKGLRRAPEP